MKVFYLSPSSRIISSRDRKGGNEDGFVYSYLYRNKNEYVLLDTEGNGCITRMWFDSTANFTGMKGNIRFYLNESSAPTIDIPFLSAFHGDFNPFLKPLVQNPLQSSGGFISYTPIPFSKRIKVSTTFRPSYYQINYYLLDHKVNSNISADYYNKISRNIKAYLKNRHNNERISGKVEIDPGEIRDIFSRSEKGEINSILISSDNLEKVVLKARWDQEEKYQFIFPLEILLKGGDTIDFNSYFAVKEGNSVNLYFPAPFSSAKIYLQNNSDDTVSVNYSIGIKEKADSSNENFRLYSFYNPLTSTSSEKLFNVCNIEGQGLLAGIILEMRAGDDIREQCKKAMGIPLDLCFLEGDESIYIDGTTEPALQGTGTEDYFNAGYYFSEGVFSLPFHGLISMVAGATIPSLTAFRWHIPDPIIFQKQLKFDIEVGPVNDITAEYSSLCIFYLTK